MHAIRYRSRQQLFAGLLAKHRHATRRATTPPEVRQRRTERREYREEIARVVYGPMREGIEL